VTNVQRWSITIEQTDTYCRATIVPLSEGARWQAETRRWDYADYKDGPKWPGSGEAQGDMFNWIADTYESIGNDAPTTDLPNTTLVQPMYVSPVKLVPHPECFRGACPNCGLELPE